MYSYEKLFKKENIYDIVLVLIIILGPIKKNKGSAIFIHIAPKKYSKTKGCVAIKKKSYRHLIKTSISSLKLNLEPKIDTSNSYKSCSSKLFALI